MSQTKYQGTHFYISPEQKNNDSYGKMVDVYALGIIYFEMNCPFSSEEERHEVIILLLSLVMNLHNDYTHYIQVLSELCCRRKCPGWFKDNLPHEVCNVHVTGLLSFNTYINIPLCI